MDASRLRQKVCRLDQRRHKLIQQVLRPRPMISGSLYQMRRRCGNPRCKCARGQLHASWYLSKRQEGRTKLTYIGRSAPEWLTQQARHYRRHQKVLAQIRKIDAEISRCLNQLRDEKTQSFEQLKGEHL